MADITVTHSDLESLAGKLDELADVLTQSEKALLLAVFGLASTALKEAAAGEQESAALAPGLARFGSFDANVVSIGAGSFPKVSDAFRDAFTATKGGDFTFARPGAEVSTISVGGETITWGN